MSIHTPVYSPGIYFITFTCHQWVPLIDMTNSYDKVYKWFDILSARGNAINAFCIMPNHLHLLLYYAGLDTSLNKVVGNGKRFLAYDIVNRLKAQENHSMLNRLGNGVPLLERKKGHKHAVWEETFDVKNCYSKYFLLQKLNYIHKNPSAGKWKLVDNPVDYLHSSASFYATGKSAGYPVKDFKEFIDWERW